MRQMVFSDWFYGLSKDKFRLQALKEEYESNQPFPHITLERVLCPSYTDALEKIFPKPDESWWSYNNSLERKFAKDDVRGEHVLIQDALLHLNSKPFVEFLEAITGIPALITDHTLRGGGLHQLARGGKLDVHADYNVHPVTRLDRRVNVLFYLNSGWKPEWGGALELWDRSMSRAEQKILPEAGRMVIFSTTDWAYHGLPDALQCPEGVTRKSIALYYYSNGRPAHEKSAPHSTIYKARPQDPVTPEMERLREARSRGRL